MAWRSEDRRLGRVVRFAGVAFVAASAFVFAGAPAQAHHYRHVHPYWRGHVAHRAHHARYAAAVSSSPAFSALLVDANSGRTLFSVAEDGLRHPASITKVMTLYLLFERLDQGTMTLQTRIPISGHAAAQEPSKLGIEAGDTISVEDAIKAIVTRSANDVAVAIAEAIGHDESAFAEMMTRKAHELGMSSTIYRNASGLPNDEQVTTARDLTILARSLEERFPRYFKYFSTHEFDYAGEVIGNHNHLLGRIDGVDGIKTGYTRASGFNLLTSVHRDGRSLIGVVLGGRTSGVRDRIMASMIEDHIAQASPARTATMVAEASPAEPAERVAAEPPAARPILVAARVPPVRSFEPQLAEGDDAEDESAKPRVAAVAPAAHPHVEQSPTSPAAAPEQRAPAGRGLTKRAEVASREAAASAAPAPPHDETTPAQLGWVKGPESARRNVAASSPSQKSKSRQKVRTPTETTVAEPTPAWGETQDDAGAHKSWMIQIGATDDEAKANALLNKARARNRQALAAATPVAQKVQKGEDTFYRARFAGLDSASAETACRSLKRSGFACFAARD